MYCIINKRGYGVKEIIFVIESKRFSLVFLMCDRLERYSFLDRAVSSNYDEKSYNVFVT